MSAPAAAGGGGGGSSNAGLLFHTKRISFFLRDCVIILQNENGPCPLVALANALILRGRIEVRAPSGVVALDALQALLANKLLDDNAGEAGTEIASGANYEQNVADAVAQLPKLATGMDVNVRFRSPTDFEFTDEVAIFDLFDVPLLHGWVVDADADPDAATAIGGSSYNECVALAVSCVSPKSPSMLDDANIQNTFRANHAASASPSTNTQHEESEEVVSAPAPVQNEEGEDDEDELRQALALSLSTTPAAAAGAGGESATAPQPPAPPEAPPPEKEQPRDPFAELAALSLEEKVDAAPVTETATLPVPPSPPQPSPPTTNTTTTATAAEAEPEPEEIVGDAAEAATPTMPRVPSGTMPMQIGSGEPIQSRQNVQHEPSPSPLSPPMSDLLSEEASPMSLPTPALDRDVHAMQSADPMARGFEIRRFLDETATQLTQAGLRKLRDAVKERELAVFFRNNHFSTIIKRDGELYILVTDLGYEKETRLVWERLNSVRGTGGYYTYEFTEFGMGDTAATAAQASTAATLLSQAAGANTVAPGSPGTTQQEDADLALALQLEEEEKEAERKRREGAQQQRIRQQQAQALAQQQQAQQQQQQQQRARQQQAQQRQQASASSRRSSTSNCTLM
ncbi:ubiquitin carboxyl-terminal hydrolase MINDY [Pseudoscourfieldia marina]